MSENLHHRPVRSYVLRQGRLTPAQQKAIDEHWQDYGIDYQAELLDLDKVFGRSAPKVLEIGAGMGDNTIAMAKRHRENDYLAIEVHRPGVGKLIRQAAGLNLSNIRVINHDVVDVISHQIMDRVIEKVFILFPDPWPKKRHHKRRLIRAGFLSSLVPKLVDHGRIYIATDWQEMAEHILTACDQEPSLFNLAGKGNFAPRPGWRPETKFETRGKGLRHDVRDLIYGINR